jgi:hypothetical protein
MRRIQNKQNGRIAQITDTYEKGGQIINYELTYEDDGTVTNLSTSTVKRWWKDIEEVDTSKQEADKYVEASKKITKELNKNNSKSLQEMVDAQAEPTTSFKDMVEEMVAEAKQEMEKAPKQKKEKKEKKAPKTKAPKRPTFDSTDLQNYAIQVVADLGGDYVQRRQNNGAKDMAQKVFRAGGKMFMHMSYPKHELRLDTRGVDVETLVPQQTLTGFYSARYTFNEDTQQVRSTIKKILTQAYNAQLAKNNKKGKGDK